MFALYFYAPKSVNLVQFERKRGTNEIVAKRTSLLPPLILKYIVDQVWLLRTESGLVLGLEIVGSKCTSLLNMSAYFSARKSVFKMETIIYNFAYLLLM